MSMKLFSVKSSLEVLASILVNLTSAWFGVMLVVPGFLGATSLEGYLKLLTANLPFAIVWLFITLWVWEKSKNL